MHDIFRLEYESFAGVYCGTLGNSPQAENVLQLHREVTTHWPSPVEDGMGRSAWSDMIFGFKSLDQMREWFDGAERYYLSTFGILLSHYRARGPIISGKKQVAFYRNCAELIWQKPLNHF